MAGLSSEGFTTKRFTEVAADLVASEQQNIDASISTADDEFLGQLNSILASTISDLWELGDSINSNFDPNTSEGRNLDDLASLIGISRFVSDASEGEVTFTGVDGTAIPVNSVFENPISKDTFKTQLALNLLTSNCYSAKYSVKTLQNASVYTITVDGTDYDYTSDADATELEILNGIESLITADLSATYAATVDTPNLQIQIVTEGTSNIVISSTTLIGSDEVVVKATVEAINTGALVVPPNSVTSIISPISGLVSVNNEAAFSLGRDIETDEELRLRFSLSQAINGLSTPEAIRALLLATEGVTSAAVFENDSTVTDVDGRPAKSFEALVEGGTDEGVATAIWTSKPAGIETYGNTTENIFDSSNTSRAINFSRPTPIYFAFRVTYTRYDEESFPIEGEDVLKQQMVDSTAALGIDTDVIVTRYFGDLYSSTDGVDSLTVEYEILAASGDTPTGTWLTAKYPIDYNETASTALQDITIVDATP